MIGFCEVSIFYLLYVVRKVTLLAGETIVFRLRAKQIVNLQPWINAVCSLCQIISVSQFQCFKIKSHNFECFFSFYFYPIPYDDFCFEFVSYWSYMQDKFRDFKLINIFCKWFVFYGLYDKKIKQGFQISFGGNIAQLHT